MGLVQQNPFQKQLEHVRLNLHALQLQERLAEQSLRSIRQQIEQVEIAVKALEPIATQPTREPPKASLAELCRAALQAQDGPVSAFQVRSYIEQSGFSLKYQNRMAVLHTTLTRVGVRQKNEHGQTVYFKLRKKADMPAMGVDEGAFATQRAPEPDPQPASDQPTEDTDNSTLPLTP